MQQRQPVRYPRVKLLLIFAAFAAPIVTAWMMLTWQIGIPSEDTAHGQVHVSVPELDDWPLSAQPAKNDAWTLVFDCASHCDERMDELWRLHRALGREAPRLQRLRIGGSTQELPGETVNRWLAEPAWREENSVWLMDPFGRPALSFNKAVPAADILDDIRHLFKVNPL
ncbi:hypothetical protein HHSLTHF2_17110 [Vreelandella venusta]|jgi:hypothetical protein|uniref:Transmembrane protein n=1 Tax=Halomonas hydrothermalis TaxID=115561 RepID=A0A6F8U3T9_9GAMM|nr:hypothetical protein [Halomonas hydrothermalis]BCB07821.1 hypothetical protein HHSLTHF2_17110 [Halomonas hydrothermalis]